MITQVEIYTPRVASSPLPAAVDGTEFTDPIQIHSIDGLGPVNANINRVQYGSQDGAVYTGSNTGERNIVLTLGLNPDWANQTPELLRQALYSYFMPKTQVTLRFSSTHMATVQIEGYVETFVPNPFSKDAEYQVSIICPKSEFVAVSPTTINGQTVPLGDTTSVEIDYQGSLPVGFVLAVKDNATTGDMVAGDLQVVNSDLIDTNFVVTTDVTSAKSFELSTVTGDKYVKNIDIPSGAETSILGKQQPGSTWIQLDQGINNFRVASSVPGQDWTMVYYAQYGGL